MNKLSLWIGIPSWWNVKVCNFITWSEHYSQRLQTKSMHYRHVYTHVFLCVCVRVRKSAYLKTSYSLQSIQKISHWVMFSFLLLEVTQFLSLALKKSPLLSFTLSEVDFQVYSISSPAKVWYIHTYITKFIATQVFVSLPAWHILSDIVLLWHFTLTDLYTC